MGAGPQRVSIPLFPLANTVLFPGVEVPLHVFEPRYRAMTADAIAGDGTLGMVAVQADQIEEMTGDPPLYPYGCAGRITRAEKLPDGRYNLVLAGTRRFRIEHEPARPASRLYRVAEVTYLDDVFEAADAPRLQRERGDVVRLFTELVRRTQPSRAEELEDGLFSGVDDPVFVNTFCQLLELEPLEKQSLLHADRLTERCERLGTLLRFRLAELSGPVPEGERNLH